MTQAISFGPLKKFNDGYQREAYPHALFYFLSVQNSTLARPGTLDHGTFRRLPPWYHAHPRLDENGGSPEGHFVRNVP
jgi:hypothetical protein